MHDPILCDMKSGDPKFFDYPSMNHFSFCGADPVNFIDPIGENILHINEMGEIVEYEEVEGDDEVYLVKGKDVVSGIIGIFDSGTLSKHVEKGKDVKGYILDVFSVKGKDAINLFKFLSNVTKVEWGLQLGKDSDGNIAGYLTTSHNENENVGQTYVTKLLNDIRFTDDYHNHPNGVEKPSGIYVDGRPGDIEAFQEMDARTNFYMNHFIYTNSKLIYVDPYEKKFNPTFW